MKLDQHYTTPDQSHSMMEPHASIAVWNGDKLTVWTSNQMIDWGRTDLATTLGIPKENIRFVSPYIGGGFGCKLFLRSDAVMAALGAKASGRPVKVALPRPLISKQYYPSPRHRSAHPDRGDRGWAHRRNRSRKRFRRSSRRPAGDGD